MMNSPTPFALATALRSYHRTSQDGSGRLETWSEVIDRVIAHQRWLWERALCRELSELEHLELEEIRALMLNRCLTPSGRSLWLSQTEIGRVRESSMFHCAYSHIETVYDVVDVFWLILQGAGIGFRPIKGTLNGFRRPLQEIRVIRSKRCDKGGRVDNIETFDPQSATWTIKVGDSAIAWAKAAGKLLAGKFPAKILVLDFSEIRPAGYRLTGYDWPSSGDELIASAFQAIAKILSDRSDQLLTRMDILDVVNRLGTVVPDGASPQMALFEYGQPEWEEFVVAKREWWLKGHHHRRLSQNYLLFQTKPSKAELDQLFQLMLDLGGSEPGFINAQEAERRAPWFKGCNPCAEILLGNKSLCQFVEVNLQAFRGDKVGLERALHLAGRMSYRMTMVNLRDEILQEAWHLNNAFLHLCGVGLTGIRSRPDLTAYDYRRMRNITVSSAYTMAQELNSPLPKNVTCVKKSTTLSQILGTEKFGDVTPGISLPLGKYLFHHLSFQKDDPLLQLFRYAGYRISEKPTDPGALLVTVPAAYQSAPFKRQTICREEGYVEELDVNGEGAIEQLEWYRQLMETWSEQNVSQVVSYDPSDAPEMIEWLLKNWDSYVGVSFEFKRDPTINFSQVEGVALPFEVVSKEVYEEYAASLQPLEINAEALLVDDQWPRSFE